MSSQKQGANPFNARLVRIACRGKIANMNAENESGLSKLHEHYRYYRKYFIFGPVLERTREQAWAYADAWEVYGATPHSPYDMAQIELLLRVAMNVESDVVYLTHSEFNRIANFYEEEEA